MIQTPSAVLVHGRKPSSQSPALVFFAKLLFLFQFSTYTCISSDELSYSLTPNITGKAGLGLDEVTFGILLSHAQLKANEMSKETSNSYVGTP